MSYRRAITTSAVAALCLSLIACGSDAPATAPGTPLSTPNTPAPVASVIIFVPSTLVTAGGDLTATVTLRDAAGKTLDGRPVQWSSSDTTIATIDAVGHVRAVAPGVVRITAVSESAHGEIQLTVRPRPAIVERLSLDVTTFDLELGQSRPITATALDAAGQPVANVPIAWSILSENGAASISPAGVVTGLAMGRATITARSGALIAQAFVSVLGRSDFDLIFDYWSADASGTVRPWLHRLDLRRASPSLPLPFQSPGTSQATLSPDGKTLAFTCDGAHGPRLCTAATAKPANVWTLMVQGHSDLLVERPVWSPDGTQIAFRGWAPGGPAGIFNPADIWVMQADGSGARRVTAAERLVDSYDAPTWSPRQPDGSYRLAFAREQRTAGGFLISTIESVRADGADHRSITTSAEQVDAEPSWSPDGRTIAFTRYGNGAMGDIWLANVNGGAARPLMSASVEPSGAQRAPVWSPDGQFIAFASNHDIIGTYFAWQIYTVRADGTDLVRRTDSRHDKGHPTWLRR